MDNYLILDIETAPQSSLVDVFNDNLTAPKNIKDPDKIKQAIAIKKKESRKAMSVDTDFADIELIGIKEIGKEPEFITLEQLPEKIQGKTIVTFNGKKFDLWIIIKQGLKQKINLPYNELKKMTDRYAINHIDLMEVIGEYGQYKSLDKYMQIYLGEKKKDIDFDNCTKEELKAHCKEDLINTEKLFKLFEPII